MLLNGPQDLVFEFIHTPEHSSPDVAIGDIPEIPLDHVQPRRTRRNEMGVESRMLFLPFLHFWMFVGALPHLKRYFAGPVASANLLPPCAAGGANEGEIEQGGSPGNRSGG